MENEISLDSQENVSTESLKLEVSWKGRDIAVHVFEGWTILNLKEYLCSITGIPAENQKLLWRGKAIQDSNMSLFQMDLFSSRRSKLMLIGSTEADIAALDSSPKEFRIRNDLVEGAFIPKGFVKKQLKPTQNVDASYVPYRFERIQALPGLPNQIEAQALLEELAMDRGIKAVLVKYKWTVNLLTELYPEGKVGVSDVCVMGLNVNNGQAIKLRLRTDDMLGFRKILSIRKVLFHELAHNVHSDHDDNFYRLMRQIERDANALDYVQSSGKRLSNTHVHHSEESESGGYILVPEAFSGGAGRLGGDSSDLTNVLSAREMAGQAAIARLSPEEIEVEHGCSCPDSRTRTETMITASKNSNHKQEKSQITKDLAPTSVKKNKNVFQWSEEKAINPINELVDAIDATNEMLVENTEIGENAHVHMVSTIQDPAIIHSGSLLASVASNSFEENFLSMGFELEAIKKAINLCGPDENRIIQFLLNGNSNVPSIETVDISSFSERELELYDAVRNIISSSDNAVAKSSIDMLIHMFQMIMENPSVSKYRRVRKNNPKLEKILSLSPSILQALLLTGWEEIGPELVFVRDDVGLLWAARSILESFRQSLQ